MPRGRPRKIRMEEYCPCCNKRGYSRQVISWSPNYKLTTRGWYLRFRHDDRNYYCYKCGNKRGTKECYINTIVKDQTIRDSPTHPLYETIKDLECILDVDIRICKMVSKFAVMSKVWPKTKNDSRGLELIRELRCLFEIYRLCVKMAMYKKKLTLQGKEMSPRTKKFFNDLRMTDPIISLLDYDIHRIRLFLDFLYLEKSKDLRAFFEQMHTIYGLPYEMFKKKVTRVKQQEGAFGTGKWD